MVRSFDLVREKVGEMAGPDLVSGVDALSLSDVDTLAERILDTKEDRVDRKPITEVWPLITLRASLFFDHLNHGSPATGYGAAGIRLSAATDLRLTGTGAFSDGIVRALMYCHGLIIEDPLRHAAEMHLGQPSDVRPISRTAITAATSSLSEIADLLDAGIVEVFYTAGDELHAAGNIGQAMMSAITVADAPYTIDDLWDEFEVEFVTGLSTPLQELWASIRKGDRNPNLKLIREISDSGDANLADVFVDALSILNPHNIIENAVTSTACTIAAIEHLGGSNDILCSSPLMAKLLFLGAPDPTDELRVHELGRTAVPNLDKLLMGDLVAIRSSSGALATWRHDLASALDYAHRARIEGVGASTVQQAVGEMLGDAREALHAEARKTRVLSQQNMVSFIAGAVGGVGGSALGGSVEGIASAGAAGVIAALIQASGTKKNVPGFLDRHYVAFASRG